MIFKIIPNWHPIFVHFSVALFSIATLFIIGSFFVWDRFKARVLDCGFLNLWLGCMFTFFTVATGFYAYNTVLHVKRSHAVMMEHRNWAFATATIYFILTGWSISLYRSKRKQNIFFVIGLIIALALLIITGWKGSEIVYRYGVGVMTIHDSISHEHVHE